MNSLTPQERQLIQKVADGDFTDTHRWAVDQSTKSPVSQIAYLVLAVDDYQENRQKRDPLPPA